MKRILNFIEDWPFTIGASVVICGVFIADAFFGVFQQ